MIRRRRTSIFALIAALPLGFSAAQAQQEGDAAEPAAEEPAASSVPTYTTGPKRMTVPKSEPAAEPQPEAVEAEPEPLLPEPAGSETAGTDPSTESAMLDLEPAPAPEMSETTDSDMVLVAADAPASNEPFVGDYTIGDPDSAVQVIEYASFTCPHCAAFHVETWPQFKADYVETGKVGFTLREVYFDQFGLSASMVARCGGEAGFYPMAEQFLKKQSEWARSDDPGAAIQKIGRLNGLTNEQLKACLENRDFAKLLIDDYQTNAEADGITSTPSFVVIGPDGREVFSGAMRYEEFKAKVDAAFGGS